MSVTMENYYGPDIEAKFYEERNKELEVYREKIKVDKAKIVAKFKKISKKELLKYIAENIHYSDEWDWYIDVDDIAEGVLKNEE